MYNQGEGVTGRIFQTAQPFYVPDVSREPLFLNKTQSRDLDKGKVAFVGVPILLQGEPIGVLNVDRLFGEEVSASEDIRFLTIVAQLIGQFVELNQQVERREELLRRQNKQLKDEVSSRYNNFFIVGKSPAMRELQGLLGKVAPAKASVLLLGESGTGKTLVARIIHEMSNRADGPFVKINCAALPENLLESELFGHAKGAFTGAIEEKPGRFEEADGGTIFLDEIAEMPVALQAKLLRFLQDKEFERLGSPKTHKVDVRIIAATNQNLPEMVEQQGLSPGPVLPAQRVPPAPAAPQGAGGGHTPAHQPLPGQELRGVQPPPGHRPRGQGRPAQLSVAGQRARARKHHRAPEHHGGPGHHKRRRPAGLFADLQLPAAGA